MVRRSAVNRMSLQRSRERRGYAQMRKIYLEAHPWCQITIFRLGLSESEVIASGGHNLVPRATQIHHRNKSDGARLLDTRWWMACCFMAHELVENHKDEARALGLLLPIQADGQGRWGDGNQALTTAELLENRFVKRL